MSTTRINYKEMAENFISKIENVNRLTKLEVAERLFVLVEDYGYRKGYAECLSLIKGEVKMN